MKKVFLGISIAALVVSCKDVPEGGNKGRLKLDDNAEHYSNDEQAPLDAAHATTEHKAAADSVATKVEAVAKDSIQ